VKLSSVTITVGPGRLVASFSKKNVAALNQGLQITINRALQKTFAERNDRQTSSPDDVQVSWARTTWTEGPADLEIQVRLGWPCDCNLPEMLKQYLKQAMGKGALKHARINKILVWIESPYPTRPLQSFLVKRPI